MSAGVQAIGSRLGLSSGSSGSVLLILMVVSDSAAIQQEQCSPVGHPEKGCEGPFVVLVHSGHPNVYPREMKPCVHKKPRMNVHSSSLLNCLKWK